jgi:copper resistance protein C
LRVGDAYDSRQHHDCGKPIEQRRLCSSRTPVGRARCGRARATTSPKQIKITFTEAVIPQFSGAEVKDQAGKAIATGKATVDPANRKQLVVPVNEPLPPGDYTVEWHAVSDDTHRVKGSYSFSVAP